MKKKELEFFRKDFGIEIYSFLNPVKDNLEINSRIKNENSEMTIVRKDSYGRWRLFSYSDSLFKINLSPVLGYETGSNNKKNYSHTWNGLYFYGYLGSHFGFSFNFRDNNETYGSDTLKKFTSVTGIRVVAGNERSIQYSEIRTTVSYDWSWGNITAGKDLMEWGYGESGMIVLSNKAPSYPFVRLNIKPFEWLRFNYFHAWLASDLIDSNEIYPSLDIKNLGYRTLFRDKYIAFHSLSLIPLRGLNFSLGESVVYSDKLEIAYLFPLMFFKAPDRLLDNNNAGGNSQFFVGISSRNHIPNTHFYSMLFIDNIGKSHNQFGYTIGGSVTDLPVNNLTLTLEYTKIDPFVYSYQYPVQSYQNASYYLGHWMGNNGDLIYVSVNYRFMRGFEARLWGQYIRKGIMRDITEQSIAAQPSSLIGSDADYTYAGIELKYEIIHELNARGRFIHNNFSPKQVGVPLQKQEYNEFYIALYYGL